MKNKEVIKQEIYRLAKKIVDNASGDSLLETCRELYEKSILWKHTPDEITPMSIKQEESVPVPTGEHTQPESQPSVSEKKQIPIDLFSSETIITEILPPSIPEKITLKEGKSPKNKTIESVAEKLQHHKITDLKSCIGINEKFQFINELFDGDMKEYTLALNELNNLSSLTEAESYILKLEEVYKWKPDNHIAEKFKELVERRFF